MGVWAVVRETVQLLKLILTRTKLIFRIIKLLKLIEKDEGKKVTYIKKK